MPAVDEIGLPVLLGGDNQARPCLCNVILLTGLNECAARTPRGGGGSISVCSGTVDTVVVWDLKSFCWLALRSVVFCLSVACWTTLVCPCIPWLVRSVGDELVVSGAPLPKYKKIRPNILPLKNTTFTKYLYFMRCGAICVTNSQISSPSQFKLFNQKNSHTIPFLTLNPQSKFNQNPQRIQN